MTAHANARSGSGKGAQHGHNGDTCEVDFRHIGREIPLHAFISLVEAVLDAPPKHGIAAGRNDTTSANSELFWTYTAGRGFHLEAREGFLNTETGNGGFSLDVRPDGSWRLSFHDSDTVIGRDAKSECPVEEPPPPPVGNRVVTLPAGASSYNASAGNITVDGGTGWATIQGGVGDYMIGGTGTLGGGQDGRGNCAIYTANVPTVGSVLVDIKNGRGYGGNAEGNILVNMNQVRGSLFSNVLIGSHKGTDMKSGGDNTIMVSTGGDGFEMRPDGRGNVMVSTAGDDWILFDPTKGWSLGDDNIMLGFDGSAGGDFLDLSMLLAKSRSNFHTTSAVGYDASTGHGDINAYVRIEDRGDGGHVMFDPYGNVGAGGYDILALKFTRGLDAESMLADGAIRV
jgi:hypothetical protein